MFPENFPYVDNLLPSWYNCNIESIPSHTLPNGGDPLETLSQLRTTPVPRIPLLSRLYDLANSKDFLSKSLPSLSFPQRTDRFVGISGGSGRLVCAEWLSLGFSLHPTGICATVFPPHRNLSADLFASPVLGGKFSSVLTGSLLRCFQYFRFFQYF